MLRRRIQISKEITVSIVGGRDAMSFPKKELKKIEDYELVEVGILYRSDLVHPFRLGVGGFDKYFGSTPDCLYGCVVGSFVPWDEVEKLITSIRIKYLLPSNTRVEILD